MMQVKRNNDRIIEGSAGASARPGLPKFRKNPLHKIPTITLVSALLSVAISVASCGWRSATSHSAELSDLEKHQLYSAALAASDSPLDTDIYRDVCRRIGIFDTTGRPNEQYMAFVSQHVAWGTQPESLEFRNEIDSKAKAREYIKKHLAAQ